MIKNTSWYDTKIKKCELFPVVRSEIVCNFRFDALNEKDLMKVPSGEFCELFGCFI